MGRDYEGNNKIIHVHPFLSYANSFTFALPSMLLLRYLSYHLINTAPVPSCEALIYKPV